MPIVTKSSHFVTVQQSGSAMGGTTSRYLAWSVGGRQHYFCSLPGILRIIEIILVIVVLILARVGNRVGCSAYKTGVPNSSLTGWKT